MYSDLMQNIRFTTFNIFFTFFDMYNAYKNPVNKWSYCGQKFTRLSNRKCYVFNHTKHQVHVNNNKIKMLPQIKHKASELQKSVA
jgi:hypothetical protein